LMGVGPRAPGATPLAQRIELQVLDPALGDGAGAKAFEGQL
jgi:hypothetical protein